MNKTEFINMCIQDAGEDETLLVIVDLFKEVIPTDVDVDSTKEPKGFYNYMKDYAQKNQKNGKFCVNPLLAKKLAIEYLQLNIEVFEKKSPEILNLEDFF